jgi:catechol 2,3-dioxygenase
MKEIGARLHHLALESAKPESMADFFSRVVGMRKEQQADGSWYCHAAERHVLVYPGQNGGLRFGAYALENEQALEQVRARALSQGTKLEPSPSPLFGASAFSVVDPDGNRLVFGTTAADQPVEGDPLPARLQHLVVRSTDPDAIVAFYRDSLGFVVSDRVLDDAGVLRACFLRSDAEHHAFAVFRSAKAQLDHHSYETASWDTLRDWADHMAGRGVPLVWGVGRHGPGNDLFFMVHDPDGNLVEISADLEICAPNRATGTWPHAHSTLNQWGVAILRS